MSSAQPRNLRRICVYCGSSLGYHPRFLAAALSFGRLLAKNDIGLVYGGTSIGLMGALADAVLDGGGEVIGVIPEPLLRNEIAHDRLRDLRVVRSMHERKSLMAELSDGFVTMPGGSGTLEELFEIWSWAHLGSHTKPCGLLNVGGFFDGLIAFLDHVTAEGFIKLPLRDALAVSDKADNLLRELEAFEMPATPKLPEMRAVRGHANRAERSIGSSLRGGS